MKISYLGTVFFLLIPPVLADGLPDLGETSQSSLSPQMERRIGENMMRDIRLREPSYWDDPEIVDYLNNLGERLISNSGDIKQDFEFFVVKDSTLNAFAMPGGFIGVHTGLILAAQSESELAGVLSHEIAHVTQRHLARGLEKQQQLALPSIAAMVVAILAARSNSQVSQAAIATTSAVNIQNQLSFSRDFEREADRLGFQMLQKSGFDARAMASFFERLQKYGRLYENNAPVYLRTHPLTTERIADMQNRVRDNASASLPNSIDFKLVNARVRAFEDTPKAAVKYFSSLIAEKKYTAAMLYGLALAQLRNKDVRAAEETSALLNKLKLAHPMVDMLVGNIKQAKGDKMAAIAIYRNASSRYPHYRALIYAYVEALYDNKQFKEALQVVNQYIAFFPKDKRLYTLQAKTYAALGSKIAQHRAQAEVYALQGNLGAAIEQLQLARKSGEGDFYELSSIEARVHELKEQQAEEAKLNRQ